MVGVWQLVLIVVICLLVFGAGRVPQIMRDLGSGVRAFRDGFSDVDAVDSKKRRIHSNTKVKHKSPRSKKNIND